MKQQFNIKKKNTVLHADITNIPTEEGILYCSVYIDGFTLHCAVYLIKNHMKDSLILDSLHEAIQKRKPSKGLIIHTD